MKKLYPGGKARAFNITYDDGVWQDVRFVAMLNRFGLKGTFNLNSLLMKEEFSWTHPNGMEVRRLPEETALWLYRGHEVSSHTLTHPYMRDLTKQELMRQLGQDKENLEKLFGCTVAGFAVPFDYYSHEIARCAEECGFEYARMSEFSHSYDPCREYYYWKTGFYHILPGLEEFVEGFLRTERELAVCQIVGHSYDLDAENLWGVMERLCARVSGQADVWPCTNLELVRYLKAMDRAVIREGCVSNPTETILWFRKDGEIFSLAPGQQRRL